MIKKYLACALAMLIVFSILEMSTFAQESEVTVEFTEGSGVVDPVNPDDPSQPLFPGGGGGLPGSGALVLNYVSPISFGPQQITSIEKIYPSLTLKPFVQVTDVRGTGEGWQLRATAGTFTRSGDASPLPGAIITMKNGKAFSANAGASVPAPTPEQNIVMQTDGISEVLVFSAAPDAGMGTWISRWYPSVEGAMENDNVTLTIPAAVAQRGSYISTIMWSLVVAP